VECLRQAAEADARAEVTDRGKNKTDYQRIADTWRTLARSYEFEGSLGRFVSFNKERQSARFLQFPSTTLKPCCLLDNKINPTSWIGLLA
jgi:hypothetical protein